MKVKIGEILAGKGYDYLGHFKNPVIIKQGHNPAVSKAQARFMYAVQGGSIKKKGLSKNKAKEFTSGINYKKLPERISK